MIVEAFAFPGNSYVSIFDQALSGTAADLRSSMTDALASNSSVVVQRCDALTERLLSALLKAAQDEVLVSQDACERTLAVLWSLPASFPMPEILVEDDGEIALDWDEGTRRLLTVSIGDSPMLRYAALIGAEPTHGRVAYAGAMPETLSFLLRRLYA
jgi:hypothetical protein